MYKVINPQDLKDVVEFRVEELNLRINAVEKELEELNRIKESYLEVLVFEKSHNLAPEKVSPISSHSIPKDRTAIGRIITVLTQAGGESTFRQIVKSMEMQSKKVSYTIRNMLSKGYIVRVGKRSLNSTYRISKRLSNE